MLSDVQPSPLSLAQSLRRHSCSSSRSPNSRIRLAPKYCQARRFHVRLALFLLLVSRPCKLSTLRPFRDNSPNGLNVDDDSSSPDTMLFRGHSIVIGGGEAGRCPRESGCASPTAEISWFRLNKIDTFNASAREEGCIKLHRFSTVPCISARNRRVSCLLGPTRVTP